MVTSADLRRGMRVALGDAPADLILRGGQVVNVFTGDVSLANVVISQDRIAAVGSIRDGMVGPQTQFFDVNNAYVVPALIDPHFHAGGTHLAVAQLTEALLQHGTTTIATDFQEFYVVTGAPGVRAALDEAARVGLRVLYMVPVHMFMVRNLGTAGVVMEQAPLMEMLTWPETMGINEPPAANLIQEENGETLDVIAAALSAGKLFPGHAVGIRDEDVDAYAAVGASSCHESVTPDQIVLKLRRGLKPWLRHGSAAPDLVNVLPAVRAHPDWMRWTCLCSDEVDPADLYQKGGMDFKIRLAVENGIAPIDAIRMATINPAEYYRVDDRLGSVSPGKLADLVVTESLSEFQVRDVVVGGRVMISQRRLTTSLQGGEYPEFVRSQIILPNAMNAGDFEFHVPTGATRVRVRVIGVEDGTLVSQPLEADLAVVNGNVESDVTRDVLKLAVIDRHTGSGRIGLSFASGFRLQRGAVSTTYCHPFYQLLVLGTNDADMARAANIMREIGGGIVVVDGENVEQWELSLVGIYTAAPFAEAQREFLRINQAIRNLGCPLKAPVLALSFVALQTIPTYGLSDKGLFDARIQGFVSPILTAG